MEAEYYFVCFHCVSSAAQFQHPQPLESLVTVEPCPIAPLDHTSLHFPCPCNIAHVQNPVLLSVIAEPELLHLSPS